MTPPQYSVYSWTFIYQDLGEKHEDVIRELKPLLSDPTVSDESPLRQVIQTNIEECERKHRLGPNSICKVAQAHSTQAEPEKTNKSDKNADTESKNKPIHRLLAQVEALTQTIDSLEQLRTQAKAPEP